MANTKPKFDRSNLLRILSTLEPGRGDISFYGLRCLKARANRGGDLSIFCKGKPRGSRKQVSITLGSFNKHTTDVSHLLKEWEWAIGILRRGDNPNDVRREELQNKERAKAEELSRQITVRQALKLYERDTSNDVSTCKERENLFGRRLPDWLDKPITDLTPSQVKDRYHFICHEVKLRNGKRGSIAEANNFYRYLNAICNWFMKEEVVGGVSNFSGRTYLENNPCRTIRPLKLKRRQSSVLSCLPAFFKTLNYNNFLMASGEKDYSKHPLSGEHGEKLRDYLIIAIFTGLRKEEILNIRAEDIDARRRLFKIPDTKNDEPHALALTSMTEPILIGRRNKIKTGYIFPGRFEARPMRSIDDRLRGFSKFIGHKFTSHDLRRTFCTIAFGETGDIRSVGQMLNHTVSNITEAYVVRHEHVAANTRDRLNKVEKAILKMAYEGKTPAYREVCTYLADIYPTEFDDEENPVAFEREHIRESIDQLGFIKSEVLGGTPVGFEEGWRVYNE